MKLSDLINVYDLENPINWVAVEAIPEFAKLKDAQQNPIWHSEGHALQHTHAVVRSMNELLSTIDDNEYKLVMLAAALFHDIGKGATTIWDKEKDAWSAPKHAIVGERLTRTLLWDEPFDIRESICSLVRNHMKPLHFIDSTQQVRDIVRLSYGVGSYYNISNLLKLKTADCSGAIQTKEDGWVDKIKYMHSVANDYGCLDKPYEFANEYSKYKFFNDSSMEYPVELYDESEFTVYIMVGLPGSGKDTWIKNNLPDLPTVCRDDIRTEIGIKGEKPMGNKKQESEVTNIFNERLLEYGRKKQSFVINNTNLKKLYRTGYQGMLNPYKPKYEYVYVEASSLDTNISRRNGQIPKDVIINMRNYFEFPHPSECHNMIIDLN